MVYWLAYSLSTNVCERNNDRALERVCKAISRNVLHVKHVPEMNIAQCNTREMDLLWSQTVRELSLYFVLGGLL
jgi:hypothetical protein